MTDALSRLRANLQAAGIAATEADLAGIAEKGFLNRLADFERITAEVASDGLPDYLDFGQDGSQEAEEDPSSVVGRPPSMVGADSVVADPSSVVGRPPSSPLAGDDTLLGVAAQIRAGAASPVELTRRALERIAEGDGRLNAFQLVLAEQALAEAQRAEAEIRAGAYRGPLHGVPVAAKDLLDIAGQPTAAGSKIRAGVIAAEDATAVARLRAAGAVVLGKTRMSEFAYSPGSNNAHYGPTCNPFDITRDTGGSSSGSAAAVAAGLAYAALGTDTGCSIRIPAAFCGLVGLKPTWGRTSLAGGVTLSWSLDHLGPLARSVADAAALLEVLAGPDPRDGRTLRPAPPFRADRVAGEVRGLRVGLLRDDGSGRPTAGEEQLAAARRAAEALAAAGADLVELDVPELDRLRVVGGAILAMEAAAFHLPWLRARLDDYGEFMRQRVLAAFAYEAGAFVRAQQGRAELRRSIGARLREIDILVTPIHPGPVPALGVPATNGLAIPFNCLGWPALTLPAGLGADGLPLSAQLAAHPWREATLLRAGHAVEAALGRLT